MANPPSSTPLDETHEQRPSRSAKVQAMANAKWRGAARQGRKRPSSTSPPRPQSSKSAKKSKSTPKSNSTAPKMGTKKGRKESQATSRKPGSLAANNDKVTHRQKASRKPPVPIVDDDEDEDLSEACLSKMPHHNDRTCGEETDNQSADTTSDNSEDGQSDEEDFDDGADGLHKLDNRSLVSTLHSERAQWSSRPQNDGQLSDEDVVPDIELTTASEVDSRPFEDDEEVQSEEDKDKNQKIARHHNYKGSKREHARRAEVPRFSQAVSNARLPKVAKPSNFESEESESSDDNASTRDDVNKGWDPSAHMVPPRAGARLISIKAQSSALQTVVKAAIREITGDALFSTAYPSAVTIVKYYCDTLGTTAKNLNFLGIYHRFQDDHKFAETVSRVLAVRLSNLRCGFKKVAAAEVKGFYLLIGGDACRERIKSLTTSMEYIYPKSQEGLLRRTKPFQHPCIISILKEFIFTSARGTSLAEKHSQRFMSSIQEGPQATELEIPVAMICMAATAVHAALDDWSEGHYKKTEFNADMYEDVYGGHESFLATIQNKSPAAFHRLMANIYNAVSSKHTQQATAVTNSAMALLDIDAMEV